MFHKILIFLSLIGLVFATPILPNTDSSSLSTSQIHQIQQGIQKANQLLPLIHNHFQNNPISIPSKRDWSSWEKDLACAAGCLVVTEELAEACIDICDVATSA